MKRRFKLLALALTAALVLTGCGGGTGEEANGGENTGSTENGGGESTGDSAAAEGDITDLVIPKLLTRELKPSTGCTVSARRTAKT